MQRCTHFYSACLPCCWGTQKGETLCCMVDAHSLVAHLPKWLSKSVMLRQCRYWSQNWRLSLPNCRSPATLNLSGLAYKQNEIEKHKPEACLVVASFPQVIHLFALLLPAPQGWNRIDYQLASLLTFSLDTTWWQKECEIDWLLTAKFYLGSCFWRCHWEIQHWCHKDSTYFAKMTLQIQLHHEHFSILAMYSSYIWCSSPPSRPQMQTSFTLTRRPLTDCIMHVCRKEACDLLCMHCNYSIIGLSHWFSNCSLVWLHIHRVHSSFNERRIFRWFGRNNENWIINNKWLSRQQKVQALRVWI